MHLFEVPMPYIEWINTPPTFPGKVTLLLTDKNKTQDMVIEYDLTYQKVYEHICQLDDNWQWWVEGIQGHYLKDLWYGFEYALLCLEHWAYKEKNNG